MAQGLTQANTGYHVSSHIFFCFFLPATHVTHRKGKIVEILTYVSTGILFEN